MKVKQGRLSLHLFAAGLILFVPVMPVHAQAYKEKPQEQLEPKHESNHDLEQLKTKVDQLQSLVEQQQRALAEVLKRLDELNGTARAVVPVRTSGADGKIAVSPDLRPAALGLNAAPNSAPPAKEAAVQDKPKPVAGRDNNHVFLRSADGSFETYLTGYGQFDYRGYQAGDHPPNTFLVRRARLSLEGKLARYPKFRWIFPTFYSMTTAGFVALIAYRLVTGEAI